MVTTIALAGKGGVGKTTISAMVIKYLIKTQPGSILAIDADPSANLNMVLGLGLDWAIGDIREDMLHKVKQSITAGGAAMGALPGGMSKQDYLNYEVHSAVEEGNRFDLIAMGQPEGPGCYCAVNHTLRNVIDDISTGYKYIVIDNEAGMEHLSRRTTRNVEHLLVVSDPTQRGLVAAERIADLRRTLDIDVENAYIILNRVPGEVPSAVKNKIDELDLTYLGSVPANTELTEMEFEGEAVVEVSDDNPVYLAISEMMENIIS